MKNKKSKIIKEAVIMVLLLVLVILVLAVALYDFIPANISISEPIEYTADSETTSVKQEIAYTNGGDATADESNKALMTSLKSYSIDASDLAVYGQKNLYNSGNSNPFDYAEEATVPQNNDKTEVAPNTASNTTTENKTTQTTTQANNNNANAGATAQGSTQGTFFENASSK